MGNIILCPIKALTNFGAGHAIIIHRYHNNGLVISPSLLFENLSFLYLQMTEKSLGMFPAAVCTFPPAKWKALQTSPLYPYNLQKKSTPAYSYSRSFQIVSDV